MALAACASLRCCHTFTVGIAAATKGLGISFSFSFSFPLSFSVGSATLSAVVEDWDCLSQVDSEDVLGVDEMSSSFWRVEVEAVPKSGEDGVEILFKACEDSCCRGEGEEDFG